MKIIKLFAVFLIIIGLASFFAIKMRPSAGTGFLEGRASVGPICPVEREGEECEISPEVYLSRKIIVYKTDGKTIFKEMNLNKEGNYRFELPAGNYVLDIARTGIDFSKDLPREIKIKAGETINLDISIDTGIR